MATLLGFGLLPLDANVKILAGEGEEENYGGTTVVEDEVLFQERDHSGVLVERCHRTSLASGLRLFRLFPQQKLCFAVPFWSPSLPSSPSAQMTYIKESEKIRLAMQPLELIKRVKEIKQEVYAEPQSVQQKDTKQTAAADLSKRLKDLRSLNDASSLKALEEWRKRKMERARQRELEKNGTATSRA